MADSSSQTLSAMGFHRMLGFAVPRTFTSSSLWVAPIRALGAREPYPMNSFRSFPPVDAALASDRDWHLPGQAVAPRIFGIRCR